MAQNRRSKNQIFEDYAYYRICDNYSSDGIPKSHKFLCELAGCSSDIRPDAVEKEVYPRIPEKYREKVRLIDDAMSQYYQIDADVDDREMLEKTIYGFYGALSVLPKTSTRLIQARMVVYDGVYELQKLLNPSGQETRFAILQRMVSEIKKNDGTFDHDPLNITARRVDYFMKNISPKKRYALLLDIKKRTIDSAKYNYDYMINNLKEEYQREEMIARYEQREDNQWRYHVIKEKELPMETDNRKKISLYQEMLSLVKDLDLNRQQKFMEKKRINAALVPLFRAEGMFTEMRYAQQECEKFENARLKCMEAARRKGYDSHH